jgi:hypothetical protein
MAASVALPPVDPLSLVREALSHLQCAESQSIPSDDQIIVGHIRTAIALLQPVAYPERQP